MADNSLVFLNYLLVQPLKKVKEVVVNILYYNREILKLQDKLTSLEKSRYDCENQVRIAERNMETIPHSILFWLESADEIGHWGEVVICKMRARRRWSFLDIMFRYKLARRAKMLMWEMDAIQNPHVGFLPGSGIYNSSHANKVVEFMDVVVEALKDDDQNSIIGLYGVVGNSERVAIQVRKRAKEEKLFDEVVMVDVVSTHPNLYKIQCDLEKKLGLEFEEGTEKKSLSERGEIVEEGLLNRKVLVILYNVQKTFELRGVGIQGDYHKRLGSKVVVIASEVGVCEEMGIQRTIQVHNVVRDIDIWDKFKRTAGVWVQKADQECIAHAFVDQCCRGYSESEDIEIRELAEKMNEWIKRTEISNGINVPDAQEVNTRRMNLFAVAARSTRVGFFKLC